MDCLMTDINSYLHRQERAQEYAAVVEQLAIDLLQGRTLRTGCQTWNFDNVLDVAVHDPRFTRVSQQLATARDDITTQKAKRDYQQLMREAALEAAEELADTLATFKSVEGF